MADVEPDLAYWTRDVQNPRDPVGRVKLSDLMNFDPRAAYKHKALWEFHLSWSHAKYNHTSLASVRTIRKVLKARSPTGKTLSIQHINEGNRDLCAWGYMAELEKGKGKRASRFLVNWELLTIAASGQFPPSVHLQGDASEVAPSVHPVGDTCVTYVGDAKSPSVHPAGDKDPATPTRLEDRVKGIDGLECAAPTAPDVSGLSPATPGTAQDEFEQLWQTYAYKHKKREAAAAFKKLAPDADLFATLLAAAAAWRTSWAAQGNSKAPRFRLDKWLEREEYDCDPPTGYALKERRTPVSAKSKAPAKQGPRVGEIVESEVLDDAYGKKLKLRFEFEGGEHVDHALYVEHLDSAIQADGHKEFSRLCYVLDLSDVRDSEELQFRPLSVTAKAGGKFEYDFPPATFELKEAA